MDQVQQPRSRPKLRDDLASLVGYHSPQASVAVRLNTNEAPAAPPSGFDAAVRAAAASIEWHRYPDRQATELRAGLAEFHEVEAGQIFCANGSNEVLQTLLLAYGGFGRSVLTFSPTYALHAHIGRITGAEVIEGGRNDDFLIELDYAVPLIAEQRPAVTFVCSPNNPTGVIEPAATVESLLEAVEDIGGLLVVDEAYGQFARWSALDLVGDTRSLAVTRTFSKTWSLAAARLGYLVGPEWLVNDLETVVLPYHLDALKQAVGLAALEFQGDMEARVAHIVEQREHLQARLAELGCEVWPSQANFVLFRPPQVRPPQVRPNQAEVQASARLVWQGLLDRSVLVRDTASWDHLSGCLRVTVGTPSDNECFLSALKEVLNE